MALDSAGNPRIDFVWGSFPVQPNDDWDTETNQRLQILRYPGDAMAEYFLDGHATKAEFEQQFGKEYSDKIKYQQGTFPSTRLNGLDGAPTELRRWNGYPDNDPNTGGAIKYNDWFNGQETQIDGVLHPNIIGVDVEEAIQAWISCGLDPKMLVPVEFDAPAPYKYIGRYYDGMNNTYYNPVKAPGTDYTGVIIYRYYAPDYVLGQHWDGSPAYAKEFHNKVQYTGWSVGYTTPIAPAPGAQNTFSNGAKFSYPHSFVVINTEDSRYDSYQWWD